MGRLRNTLGVCALGTLVPLVFAGPMEKASERLNEIEVIRPAIVVEREAARAAAIAAGRTESVIRRRSSVRGKPPYAGPRAPIGILRAGSVDSQANGGPPSVPGGLRAAEARTLFGVDGAGVRIGIVSDSFNRAGGTVPGVSTGDLPGPGNPLGRTDPVVVLDEDTSSSRIDEGRAMAELIHDLAPGAELYFHSGFNNIQPNQPGESSIAFAIDALATAGCDIIVDDIGFLSQPYFQDGLAAASIDAFVATGGMYFSAAGNSGSGAWFGAYGPTGSGEDIAHDFDPGPGVDTQLTFDFPSSGSVRLIFWWSEPYPSLGAPVNPSDFDIFAYRGDTGALVDESIADQPGGADPFEIIVASNSGASTTLEIVVEPFGVVDPAVTFGLVAIDGTVIDDNRIESGAIFGHPGASGALALAAQRYSGAEIEQFSSRGPVTIFFGADSSPLGEVRAKPDLTATDGTDNTFFGFDYESNGFPNFFGTSAAAPHAAAVAALGLESYRDALGADPSPSEFYGLLSSTAVDMGEIGPDAGSGAGRVDAVALLAAIEALTRTACIGDTTTTGATLSGQPGFGVPDSAVDTDDLGYYLNFWAAGFISVADLTTTGATLPGQPAFGEPDGVVDLDDLGFFLNAWLAGCP